MLTVLTEFIKKKLVLEDHTDFLRYNFLEEKGRVPFDQNFRKSRFKIEWNRKFPENRFENFGPPLERLSFFLEIWKFRKFPVPFGESAPVP